MFDFHIHSQVSFDGHDAGRALAQAALDAGLKEICFTDHLDYDPTGQMGDLTFRTEVYNAEYDHLALPGLTIRRGVEFGLTRDNQAQFRKDLARRPFDFVLGSIHFVDGLDVYFEPFWQGKTVYQVEQRYLEETLACVQVHEDFDVLAHLTYISKPPCHPTHAPLSYVAHREVIDEILRVLAEKGKGLEICLLYTSDAADE